MAIPRVSQVAPRDQYRKESNASLSASTKSAAGVMNPNEVSEHTGLLTAGFTASDAVQAVGYGSVSNSDTAKAVSLHTPRDNEAAGKAPSSSRDGRDLPARDDECGQRSLPSQHDGGHAEDYRDEELASESIASGTPKASSPSTQDVRKSHTAQSSSIGSIPVFRADPPDSDAQSESLPNTTEQSGSLAPRRQRSHLGSANASTTSLPQKLVLTPDHPSLSPGPDSPTSPTHDDTSPTGSSGPTCGGNTNNNNNNNAAGYNVSYGKSAASPRCSSRKHSRSASWEGHDESSSHDFPSSRRSTVTRSGNITERDVDVNGVRKVVLDVEHMTDVDDVDDVDDNDEGPVHVGDRPVVAGVTADGDTDAAAVVHAHGDDDVDDAASATGSGDSRHGGGLSHALGQAVARAARVLGRDADGDDANTDEEHLAYGETPLLTPGDGIGAKSADDVGSFSSAKGVDEVDVDADADADADVDAEGEGEGEEAESAERENAPSSSSAPGGGAGGKKKNKRKRKNQRKKGGATA